MKQILIAAAITALVVAADLYPPLALAIIGILAVAGMFAVVFAPARRWTL